jgi:quercetin dioxygenase-like cupin family protein
VKKGATVAHDPEMPCEKQRFSIASFLIATSICAWSCMAKPYSGDASTPPSVLSDTGRQGFPSGQEKLTLRSETSTGVVAGKPLLGKEQVFAKSYRALVGEVSATEPRRSNLWTLRRDETIRINLVEISSHLPLHIHPDADHSILVIRGVLIATVGAKNYRMEQGDFISIPAGTIHGYALAGPDALFVSMDAPYYDPKKTIYLPVQ